MNNYKDLKRESIQKERELSLSQNRTVHTPQQMSKTQRLREKKREK